MNYIFKKRIDELGRIVIPKELRNRFRINSFDELEMSNDEESIIIKKSKSIEVYKDKLNKLVNFANFYKNFIFVISDNEKVISSTANNYSYGSEININIVKFKNRVILCEKTELFKNIVINGYVYLDRIIIDSNNYGYIYIINNNNFSEDDKKYITLFKDNLINMIS